MTRKVTLIAAMLIVGIYAAHAIGVGGEGLRFGRGGSSGKRPTAVVQPTGKILLIDGTSFLLLLDGTSKLCRVGGC